MAFGLRYLWIDALCIVPDEEYDWATKTSLMHRVYSSAYVTIATLASELVYNGFLPSATWRAPELGFCLLTQPNKLAGRLSFEFPLRRRHLEDFPHGLNLVASLE